MILYGRNLSPFARRIAIWCALQGREIERRDILVTGDDFKRLATMNPVARVPVLELDDGTQMIESYAMGDWLDETSPNGVRLIPASGVERREALQHLALASGTAEKAVALVYERNRRPEEFHWKEWQQRLVGQIQGGLSALEARAAEGGWPDGPPTAGAVSAAIAYQFIEATNPWVLDARYPALAELVEKAMAIPAFAETKPAV